MKRKAVSLLEVLFSIGIVAIGLLGTLSVVAVGGHKASHGKLVDDADRFGREAVRTFDVRGMRDQGSWTAPLVPGVSYCLDPVFVAVNGTSGPARFFPAFDPAVLPGPRMVRMSLRDHAGNPISQAASDLAFACQDELATSLPDDATELAQQTYVANGPVKIKRQSAGTLTWAAQLVPQPGVVSNQYLLYVIVFNRRDLTLPATTPSEVEPEAERLVDVAPSSPMQTDCGDLLLTARSGRPIADLKIATGNWVMLAQPGRFGWYRVQSVEDVDVSTNSRHVTAFGGDWNFSAATQAVLVGDVVAVYEKTVRLGTQQF